VAKEVLLKTYSPAITATGILLLARLATFATPALAQGPELPHALTAEQVDCSADQLRGLLHRSALLFGPYHIDRTATLLWTYGPPGGFEGLAVIEPFDEDGKEVAGEDQLAFSAMPSPVKLLRNPGRPQLDSLVVTRDPLNSDLSRFEQSHAAALVVDPTVEPLKNEDPSSLIVIDNLELDDDGIASAAKPGRGLAALLTPCGSAFTRTDLHVFGVLSRVVRGLAYTGTRTAKDAQVLSKLAAVYRGAESSPLAGGGVRAAYRIDLFPTGKVAPGRIALEMLIDIGADGSLGNASLRVLPACASEGQRQCTSVKTEAVIGVIHPAFGDQRWNLAQAPAVCWGAGADCRPEVSFSFQDVLQGTTWLKAN
jgi:hypothetical protein